MDLRYPIGEFKYETPLNDDTRQACIAKIEETPARMRAAVAGLNEEQLDTAYRPEGWTVRQVVHHVPESHLTSYIRFKLAITEDEPTIKPYFEDRWAKLDDARQAPIALSLDLLDALHGRWIWFLRSLKQADFQRAYLHPELGTVSLDKAVALYAWHGPHHVAQITSLRERMGW
ncbi:MAG: YfiT family bacillithiol transferase [Pyrinomonadaceae bacterium]